jgi:haloalkane dehalogenase
LKWPRSIPIAGEPADVVAIVESYAAFMAQNSIPKFFVSANPGAILTGAPREFCRTWKNQTEITVEGRHFIQESSGATIGKGIAAWIKEKSL